MVENKTRGEQLFEDVKGGPSFGLGSLFQGKAKGAIDGIRDFFFKPWTKPDSAGEKPAASLIPEALSVHKLDLKTVNQVLGLILAGLIALTVYVAFGEQPNISSVAAAVSKIKFQDIEDKAIMSFDKLSFYLGQIKTRDIFNEYEEPKPPAPVVKPVEPPPPPPPPKVTIEEKAKGLKLMGISWGSAPKVIIKNNKTQEVYFLKEGEVIKGTEITVKQILKDEVVITSDDEDMKML